MNDNKKRFCDEYIITLNATQAAIKAGYSEKTARSKASHLLDEDEIIEYISKLKQKTAEKLDLSHDRIAEEWMKLAFSSIADMHNTWVERKEFDKLTNEQKACISEIVTQIKTTRDVNGQLTENEYVKIKLHSKTKALEELGKHTGFYELDNAQKTQTDMSQYTTKELKERAEALKKLNG